MVFLTHHQAVRLLDPGLDCPEFRCLLLYVLFECYDVFLCVLRVIMFVMCRCLCFENKLMYIIIMLNKKKHTTHI